MTQPQSVIDFVPQLHRAGVCGSCSAAGALLAESLVACAPGRTHSAERVPHAGAQRILRRAAGPAHPNRNCVLDNPRLLQAAETAAGELALQAERLPAAIAFGARRLRVSWIAGAYLDHTDNRFEEDTCIAFLEGFQRFAILTMEEIARVQQALQSELLERLDTADADLWPKMVGSLRDLTEAPWQDVFDAVNRVDRVLERDPAGAYSRMDLESRAWYRAVIARLAERGSRSECEIAETAVALAAETPIAHHGSRASARRAHVGYYLVDRGVGPLEREVGYRPAFLERITRVLLRWPAPFYFAGIAIVAFAAIAAIFGLTEYSAPMLAAIALLLVPASQAAMDLIHGVLALLLPPRVLPKLDFSGGIPDDCATLVAVPSLLLNEMQVRGLVRDLEIRFLANRDPNLSFALVTDLPDAPDATNEPDPLVGLCRSLIEDLNWNYPGSPFLLLHRDRTYNQSEGCWMGWERKRGKLIELNRLLRGDGDAFPLKAGNVALLRRVRFVITLDSDTQLPRDSAAKLAGAIAHPLNAAVIDPTTRTVIEGYGILQPRIGIGVRSSSRSRLAALCSGETGFDIYTCAVSDSYQDLFAEGIFTGKGIYEVDVLHELLDRRFPENALLSHDLIEGCYARAALVSDIELVDDYPSHFSAYSRRKHRWVRGDWQILGWIFHRVPDENGRSAPNPISAISKWKIADNLRRSLFAPSLIALLMFAWFVAPKHALFWTGTAISMLLIPVYWNLVFSAIRSPRKRGASLAYWARTTFPRFLDGHRMALFHLVFLLHQAILCMDAIARTIPRLWITRRKLLEWETALESETASRGDAPVDVYLQWVPVMSMAIGLLLAWLRPEALSAALPVLTLWFFAGASAAWLDRPTDEGKRALSREDDYWLREKGRRICRYFLDWSSPATHWLIPDNVNDDGEADLRLSPTNLGMLLNARIAAIHLRVSTLAQFVYDTRQTLATVDRLPKYRGHLLNWYDVSTLQPIPAGSVSSVDSGNLAAALWTLKQAALAFAAEHRGADGLREDLMYIAFLCDRLVGEMDFSFLYCSRRRALSVGYDLARRRLDPACYDLLASEARTAAFIAIAKGDIPQDAWRQLGRAHALCGPHRALASWTGSMFEYLMPWLWMRHHPWSVTGYSARAAVAAQRRYGREKGVPWGISESAHHLPGGEVGYGPFGLPALALNPAADEKLVVAPYASLLAAQVDPTVAIENLRRMEELGWCGRYGFYESVDYSRPGGKVIRFWMAHHQGMSLLAICNVLFDGIIQRYFHAEPHVAATERLLHERLIAPIACETEQGLPPPDSDALPAPG